MAISSSLSLSQHIVMKFLKYSFKELFSIYKDFVVGGIIIYCLVMIITNRAFNLNIPTTYNETSTVHTLLFNISRKIPKEIDKSIFKADADHVTVGTLTCFGIV